MGSKVMLTLMVLVMMTALVFSAGFNQPCKNSIWSGRCTYGHLCDPDDDKVPILFAGCDSFLVCCMNQIGY